MQLQIGGASTVTAERPRVRRVAALRATSVDDGIQGRLDRMEQMVMDFHKNHNKDMGALYDKLNNDLGSQLWEYHGSMRQQVRLMDQRLEFVEGRIDDQGDNKLEGQLAVQVHEVVERLIKQGAEHMAKDIDVLRQDIAEVRASDVVVSHRVDNLSAIFGELDKHSTQWKATHLRLDATDRRLDALSTAVKASENSDHADKYSGLHQNVDKLTMQLGSFSSEYIANVDAVRQMFAAEVEQLNERVANMAKSVEEHRGHIQDICSRLTDENHIPNLQHDDRHQNSNRTAKLAQNGSDAAAGGVLTKKDKTLQNQPEAHDDKASLNERVDAMEAQLELAAYRHAQEIGTLYGKVAALSAKSEEMCRDLEVPKAPSPEEDPTDHQLVRCRVDNVECQIRTLFSRCDNLGMLSTCYAELNETVSVHAQHIQDFRVHVGCEGAACGWQHMLDDCNARWSWVGDRVGYLEGVLQALAAEVQKIHASSSNKEDNEMQGCQQISARNCSELHGLLRGLAETREQDIADMSARSARRKLPGPADEKCIHQAEQEGIRSDHTPNSARLEMVERLIDESSFRHAQQTGALHGSIAALSATVTELSLKVQEQTDESKGTRNKATHCGERNEMRLASVVRRVDELEKLTASMDTRIRIAMETPPGKAPSEEVPTDSPYCRNRELSLLARLCEPASQGRRDPH